MRRRSNFSPSWVLAFVLLLIILSVAVGTGVFIWRMTEHLTPMSSGMILGLVISFFGIAMVITPFMIYNIKSREADKAEFMAIAGKRLEKGDRPPASSPQLPTPPREVWDEWQALEYDEPELIG